jgi:hypothetical protein
MKKHPLLVRLSCVRVEFDLRTSNKTKAPLFPTVLSVSVKRLEEVSSRYPVLQEMSLI